MNTTTYPDKDYATARARAALAGVELCVEEEYFTRQVYHATRGMASYTFPTLGKFLAWLDRVETRGQRYGT
jgi:hypothetical protein